MFVKSRNVDHIIKAFDTHYDWNCDCANDKDPTIEDLNYDISTMIQKSHNSDRDVDQDHTINDFDSHYDQNCDRNDDKDHTIKHLNYKVDDVY